jgi:hypothetical protein
MGVGQGPNWGCSAKGEKEVLLMNKTVTVYGNRIVRRKVANACHTAGYDCDSVHVLFLLSSPFIGPLTAIFKRLCY